MRRGPRPRAPIAAAAAAASAAAEAGAAAGNGHLFEGAPLERAAPLPSFQSTDRMTIMLTDKQITCVDCGTEFTFTSGEQERFAQLGFTNEPKRCGPCRQAKKASRG